MNVKTDSATRLTNITYQAAATNKIDYAYDETGNRASQVSALAIYNLPSAITNSSYDAANQQLTFGGYAVQFDANGNVTNLVSGATTNRLFWNARNQLTNMTGSVAATFLYDGLGRRITRTVGADAEKYLYDGLDITLAKNVSDSVITRHFRSLAIDEPWQRIDVAKKASDNTNRVYLADALGSIVALTDPNKTIQTEYDYDPFGSTTTTGQGNRNVYKFTAREDDGTGLYYYRTRYYHPTLRRFVTEDTLETSVNLYIYASGIPVSLVDPLGLDSLTPQEAQAVQNAIDAIKANGKWSPFGDVLQGLLDQGKIGSFAAPPRIN